MANTKNNERDRMLRSILETVVDPKLLPAQLNDEIQLQRDLNIDSIRLVDLVLNMEESYSIRVPDEDVESIRTVGDLARLIPAAAG